MKTFVYIVFIFFSLCFILQQNDKKSSIKNHEFHNILKYCIENIIKHKIFILWSIIQSFWLGVLIQKYFIKTCIFIILCMRNNDFLEVKRLANRCFMLLAKEKILKRLFLFKRCILIFTFFCCMSNDPYYNLIKWYGKEQILKDFSLNTINTYLINCVFLYTNLYCTLEITSIWTLNRIVNFCIDKLYSRSMSTISKII